MHPAPKHMFDDISKRLVIDPVLGIDGCNQWGDNAANEIDIH